MYPRLLLLALASLLLPFRVAAQCVPYGVANGGQDPNLVPRGHLHAIQPYDAGDTVTRGDTITLEAHLEGEPFVCVQEIKWYSNVDGLILDTTQETATLDTSNMSPGNHEICAIVKQRNFLYASPCTYGPYPGDNSPRTNFMLNLSPPPIDYCSRSLDEWRRLEVNIINHYNPDGVTVEGTKHPDLIIGSDPAVLGGSGGDNIKGKRRDDCIYGFSGDDTLSGGAGSDTIVGGAGNDDITGGGGGDVLFGDDGDDTLSGRSGKDILCGGAGYDSMDGRSGKDVLDAGADGGGCDGGARKDRCYNCTSTTSCSEQTGFYATCSGNPPPPGTCKVGLRTSLGSTEHVKLQKSCQIAHYAFDVTKGTLVSIVPSDPDVVCKLLSCPTNGVLGCSSVESNGVVTNLGGVTACLGAGTYSTMCSAISGPNARFDYTIDFRNLGRCHRQTPPTGECPVFDQCVPNTLCIKPLDNLVAWWAFDGDASGPVARDVAGVTDGSIFGATLVAGKVVGALSFNGISDHVKVLDYPTINFADRFGIGAWFRTSAAATQTIVGKGQGLGAGYRLFVDAGGTLGFFYGDGVNTVSRVLAGPFVADGSWHHVGFSATPEHWSVYVDGSVQDWNSFSASTPPSGITNTDPLYVGAQDSGSGLTDFFSGEIDELSLFNDEFDGANIQRTFLAGDSGMCRPEFTCADHASDPIAWWRGDSCDATDFFGRNNGSFLGLAQCSNVSKVGGGGLFFNGASWVNVPHNGSLDLGLDSFTIEGWLRTAASDGPILSKGLGGVTPGYRLGIAAGLLQFVACDSTVCRVVSSARRVDNLSWRHVAVTVDQSIPGQTTLLLYVDGDLDGSSTVLPSLGSLDSPNALLIGASDDPSASALLNGVVDELEVYRSVLEDEEVQDIVDGQYRGKCDKDLDTCGITPASGCLQPFPQGGALQIKNSSLADNDRLTWTWKGAGTTLQTFGNPLVSTNYDLCMYDGNDDLIMHASAPAGGTCNAVSPRPCWKVIGNGYRYVDTDLTPNGLQEVLLKSGSKGQITVKGKGALLDMPTLPIDQPVVVQLFDSSNSTCWEADYNAAAIRNDATQFHDRSD